MRFPILFALVAAAMAPHLPSYACSGDSPPLRIELEKNQRIRAEISQEFFIESTDANPTVSEARFIRKPSALYLDYYRKQGKTPKAIPLVALSGSAKDRKRIFELGDLESRKQIMDQGISFTLSTGKAQSAHVQIELFQLKGGCGTPTVEDLPR